MMSLPSAPLALHLDAAALRHNWQWLAEQSGSATCGAAVKADAYGLGAPEVVQHLNDVGCRDYFVATWAEAQSLKPHLGEAQLSVLHGVREEDMATALHLGVKPVLNSAEQIQRWRGAGGGLCDVMIDTGMNRLGLDANAITTDLFEGLEVDVVMSHLACADDPSHSLNMVQRMIFGSLAGVTGARRKSMANSAGILLGSDYAYDLTRPGLSLYGGGQVPAAEGHIRQVVRPHAQILQTRLVRGGESVGYGATYTAPRQHWIGILNVGYADGYLRAFTENGAALDGGAPLPVVGRVSMDLIAVNIEDSPWLSEGDWLEIAYDLPTAAAATGLSQYELLTGLGQRFDRKWV